MFDLLFKFIIRLKLYVNKECVIGFLIMIIWEINLMWIVDIYMYLYIDSGEYIKYECNMWNDNILFYGV